MNERINAIREAQRLVAEACELIKAAVEGTDVEFRAEAYGYCGLERALGKGNPYDDSLDDVIEMLEANDD